MTSACPACDAADFAVDVATKPMSVTLSVPGIKCAACIGTIERGLRKVPGVRDARVNMTLKRVSVATSRTAEELVSVIESLGFEAFAFDADVLAGDNDPVLRELLLRIGVAGFAMMNVMLLSVAVWSGATDATRDLFHLISAAISLPAALYAGQPFFRSAWAALQKRRLNMDVPISLAILLAGGMSLFEALNSGAHAYFDAALSLTFFLLIGRALEHKTRASARSAARELAALEVHTAERLQNGQVVTVPVRELAVGDRVLVAAGTRIPVDGTLIRGEAFTDSSFLTGESEPQTREAGDLLQAGEINLGAPFEMTASAIGEDTRLWKMARLVETAETVRNQYTSVADRVAGFYAPVVHILAAVTFIGWWFATGDARHALNIAIAVLIITCPCALGLAVPAVSTAAIGQLYRLGFLVKSGTALERLSSVDTVVLDKTGTLTKPGFAFDLNELSERDRQIAKALAQRSSHPVSRALAQHLSDVPAIALDCIKEDIGKGLSANWKGTCVSLAKGEGGLVLRVGRNSTGLHYHEVERPGAGEMLAGFRQHNVLVHLLSGDTAAKTSAMARHLGINGWTANVTPEDKHDHISQLVSIGRKPCMIGDGINDTAALQAAQVSVAPGTALDAARSASDVIMLGEKLGDLPELFAVSRRAVMLYKQNFGIAFAYNAMAIPFAMAGFATPLMAAIAMSTSSILVLLNATRARSAI